MEVEEQIKQFKILLGMFHEEMKSNSTIDLMVWLDCRIELDKQRRTDAKKNRVEGYKK